MFLLMFLSDFAHADELDVASKTAEVGLRLLGKNIEDRHTLHGTCQIANGETDNFPRPCSFINLSLISKKGHKERSFQTDKSGNFLLTSLEDNDYQLKTYLQGYELAKDSPTLVRGGQSIMITLIRSNNK